MKRVTKHIKNLVGHIISEGMGHDAYKILELANFEWECETNRPYTYEDYVWACNWIDKKLS